MITVQYLNKALSRNDIRAVEGSLRGNTLWKMPLEIAIVAVSNNDVPTLDVSPPPFSPRHGETGPRGLFGKGSGAQRRVKLPTRPLYHDRRSSN